MASPHIAGLAALMMGQSGKMTPAQLSTAITGVAQTGLIAGIPRGTTNTLAFNNAVPVAQLQQALANLGQTGAAANSTTSAAGAATTGRQGRNRNN